MTTEAKGDFDGFDTSAGVMAYVYSKEGAESLRVLLAMVAAERETLERDAQELLGIGLPDVAQIVLEAAADTPEPECPFDEESADARDWVSRQARKAQKRID